MILIILFVLAFLVEQATHSTRTKNTESTLHTAKAHIAEVMRQRADLERRLATTNAALAEHMARETRALEKVQEVLQVAETAIAEKNAAQQRELEIKEECDHLASTIGQVMQEATAKCELDVQTRQARYAETIRTLENHIGQVRGRGITRTSSMRRRE